MCLGSMTPGSREGVGVDGRQNPSRKPEACDEEESGEQASEERSTKADDRVETLHPSAAGLGSGSAPVSPPNRTGLGSNQQQQQPNTSTEPAPPCHDQHHFLRSSVRPPSKRIRKDSVGSTINGHSGAKSKGKYCTDEREAPALTFHTVTVCSLFILKPPCCFMFLGHLTGGLCSGSTSGSPSCNIILWKVKRGPAPWFLLGWHLTVLS